MNDNNGGMAQFVTQFLCWFTAVFSYMKGLSLSDWGVIIGLIMSGLFGAWGAWNQHKRTKLEEERTALLRAKLKADATKSPKIVPPLKEWLYDDQEQTQ